MLTALVSAEDKDGEMLYILAESSIPELKPRDADDLLARTLEELIGNIGQHKRDGLGAHYVDTALALARRCKDSSLRAARQLFEAVDGILKRRGDENKVFEAANLSIEASKHSLRDDDDVKIEARALICGQS
jgi:hypothetical protein